MQAKLAYYQVMLQDESDVGLLFAAPEVPYFNPQEQTYIASWEPISASLRDGRSADLMRCPIGFNVCTKQLRDAVQAALGANDKVQWLEFKASFPDGRHESCWGLYIYEFFDVLDPDKTLWIKDYPRRPVVDGRKAAGHHLFKLTPHSAFFMVSDEMRRVMERFDCSAYEFVQREVV